MTAHRILRRMAIAGLAVVAVPPAGLAGFSALVALWARRTVPPAGRMVCINGAWLHVHESGDPDGPPLLLVHGLGGNLRNLTATLAGRLSRFRVVAFDRPGSGFSPPVPGRPGGIRDHAGVVRDVIEALDLERPLIVGHSLGGAIALATALDHPGHVGGLALLAPLTYPETEVPEIFRAFAIESGLRRRLVAWLLAVPGSFHGRARAMGYVFGPEPVPSWFDVAGGGRLGRTPGAFESASRDMMASRNDLPWLAAGYGAIAVPAGILHGTGDRILSHTRHGARMAGLLPGLVYEEIAEAGHMLPLTQPGPTAAFIERIAARMADNR